MRRRLVSQSAEKDLDISPLIDVVFILLIFFMVSTTFVKDMKLDLVRPGAASAVSAPSKSLRIHVDRHLEVYVDGQSVKPWMLQSRVREFVRAEENGSILVITDKSVPADRLIQVVDQCRLAGARDVGVATDREAG